MILSLISFLLLCSNSVVNGYIIEKDGQKILPKTVHEAQSENLRGSKVESNLNDIIVVTLKPKSNNIHEILADVRKRDADTAEADFVAPVRKEFQRLGIFTLNKPSEKVVKFLESHVDVLSVGPSRMYYPAAAYSWGTDRIDQKNLPLDNSYTVRGPGGAGTNIYIIDEGLDTNHIEFSNTNEREVANIFDAYSSTLVANNDQGGHGTHCAGTASGISVGVAPKANLYGVKVLGPNGGATEDIVAGMDKVLEHATAHPNNFHVASMSLGGFCLFPFLCQTDPMVAAVERLADAGILTVAAAGNDNMNSCLYTPASAPEAITVGSTTITDGFSSFSNYGTCVDILAPGSDITSACAINNDIADAIEAVCTDEASYMTISGTSMATPHVTGVVSLILEVATKFLGGQVSPTRMKKILQYLSASGKISAVPSDTPNKLLQVPPEAVFANLRAEMQKFAPDEEW